ncbi:KR domain protein [Leptospira ryugenii]|uniref:KR domain protein n=1 Tax=Leptospira ryugenii TaxID=1917863 RepID=A0A2P2E3N6_9LEPT|nr:SDR family NAD(P)-dependent oxidoreductase [Leptospira ryugenii]GBF51505.1 KR domain protein [Leptospira ryugenii]
MNWIDESKKTAFSWFVEIKGKTALITGAGMGIGALVCEDFAKLGIKKIIGVDVDTKALKEMKLKIESYGVEFESYPCDLSSVSQIEALFSRIQKKKVSFEILINNAGIAPSGSFVDGEFQKWEKAIQINVTGLIKVTHLALPILSQAENAHIVNLASIAGKYGSEGTAVYSATKHAVVGFSHALRMEYYEKNIGVSWVCPTMAKTRMIEGVKPSIFTPVIPPLSVALAIRKAIQKNQAEVMVPSYLRLSIVVLPTLFPRFFFWLAVKLKVSKGWLDANKGLEKNIPV